MNSSLIVMFFLAILLYICRNKLTTWKESKYAAYAAEVGICLCAIYYLYESKFKLAAVALGIFLIIAGCYRFFKNLRHD